MSASAEPSKPASHSGLKESTAIGVGVGVGMGGLLILCLAVFLLRRRRAHKATSMSKETAELDSVGLTKHAQVQDTKAKYSAESSTNRVRHELAGEGRSEPHELDGQNRVELDGSDQPEPRDGGFKPHDQDGSGR